MFLCMIMMFLGGCGGYYVPTEDISVGERVRRRYESGYYQRQEMIDILRNMDSGGYNQVLPAPRPDYWR